MIIIADDNPTDRVIIETILNDIGFKGIAFNNGIDAYNAINTSKEPVIAILDWEMPGLNGIDICQRLYNDPPQQPFHIIIVTAKTTEHYIYEALDKGANDFIEKPIKSFELKARIKAGLRILSIAELQIESNVRLLDYTTRIEQLAQERAQQLIHAERLSSLGVLSAGLAHEINNPVSFISVNINTLEENFPKLNSLLSGNNVKAEDYEKGKAFLETMPEILDEMKSGIDRIMEIINGLKTYVYKDNSQKKHFSIIKCINEAIKLCKNRLKYNITLMLNLIDDFELFGSENEMQQIFVNLLINATDAIEGHKTKGTISVSTRSTNNNFLITIEDNGPGLPEDKTNQIFTPFFTTKEVGKGTGLGLSISQNILKKYNGEIYAENIPNGGAKFNIILPNKIGVLNG